MIEEPGERTRALVWTAPGEEGLLIGPQGMNIQAARKLIDIEIGLGTADGGEPSVGGGTGAFGPGPGAGSGADGAFGRPWRGRAPGAGGGGGGGEEVQGERGRDGGSSRVSRGYAAGCIFHPHPCVARTQPCLHALTILLPGKKTKT